MFIQAHCKSWRDDYAREEWPEQFVALPRIGDKVEAKSGRYLWVMAITHKERSSKEYCHKEPYIFVELGLKQITGG